MEEGEEGEEDSRGLSAPCRWASPECFPWCGCAWRVNESSMKSYSQMKRSTLPVRSPPTREKGQQNQESRQPAQRDKSTKSVQETVINSSFGCEQLVVSQVFYFYQELENWRIFLNMQYAVL